MTVTVTRESDDGLRKKTWTFWYYKHALVLDSFSLWERPSKRHKFNAVSYYMRLDERHSPTSRDDVEIPDDVRDEAVRKFVNELRVMKWQE